MYFHYQARQRSHQFEPPVKFQQGALHHDHKFIYKCTSGAKEFDPIFVRIGLRITKSYGFFNQFIAQINIFKIHVTLI